MNFSTLTLYLIAGALSISLGLLMMAFAHLRSGSGLMKNGAIAILMLSAALLVSAYGPELPRWMTVMGSNMVLLAAGAVLYSGFAAYCEQRKARVDRFGWGLTALTALPFWYWGLIEPDGNYRSAVFSFAAAAINARTAWLLLRQWLRHRRSVAVAALAILFSIFTAGMAARGVLAIMSPMPPANLRGANPTDWTTVAAYIVLISLMSISIMWMEIGRTQAQRREFSHRVETVSGFSEYFRHRLLLLWAVVIVLVLAIASEAGLFYTKSFEWEQARLTQTAELSNDALVHHSMQIMTQVDTILHSVRSFYLRTHSIDETESFIHSLPFDKSVIDNVYVITGQGRILMSHDPLGGPLSAADRDYFVFHQSTTGDHIFIGSVESGLVTGKFHFRVTRRISNADGSFAGVVVGTVDPQAFSRYYQERLGGKQNSAALVGTSDKKFRARVPELASDRWQVPLASMLWEALQQAPAGNYKSTSAVDSIPRIFAYQKVGDLPLVMVTGFSQADIRDGVHERIRWLAAGSFTVLLIILILATLLTVEIRRRTEQDNFLSMLSHELKTPLSVLRMALSQDSLSERTRAHAQHSVQEMDAVIYRCLQADRLQQRGHAVARQACQLGDLLADLQTASPTPERLEVSAPDLPMLSTDPQLLSIAMNNLVENALKYSPAQSLVQVSARSQVHRRRPGILVVVSNAVGNVGMPEARQVFKKYYRGARAHSKTGSGLGLYLVHSVARLLGGWVRYAPTEGQVRFEFWLPQ